jgi:hypothetical protein
MFKLNQARAAIESEGVYIGGWDIKQAIWPSKNARNGNDLNSPSRYIVWKRPLIDMTLRHQSTWH